MMTIFNFFNKKPKDNKKNIVLKELYEKARNARECGDMNLTKKYYDELKVLDSNNWEPHFFAGLAAVSGSYINDLDKLLTEFNESNTRVLFLIKKTLKDKKERDCAINQMMAYIELVCSQYFDGIRKNFDDIEINESDAIIFHEHVKAITKLYTSFGKVLINLFDPEYIQNTIVLWRFSNDIHKQFIESISGHDEIVSREKSEIAYYEKQIDLLMQDSNSEIILGDDLKEYFEIVYSVDTEGNEIRTKIIMNKSITLNVVGLQYRDNYEKILEQIKIGTIVTLKPEPTNPVDPDALAFYLDDGTIIGYLPKKDQPFAKLFFEQGYIKAKVSIIDGPYIDTEADLNSEMVDFVFGKQVNMMFSKIEAIGLNKKSQNLTFIDFVFSAFKS